MSATKFLKTAKFQSKTNLLNILATFGSRLPYVYIVYISCLEIKSLQEVGSLIKKYDNFAQST